MKKLVLQIVSCLFAVCSVFSQEKIWLPSNENRFSSFEKLERESQIASYKIYTLDVKSLQSKLTTSVNRANTNNTPLLVLPFPNAHGILEEFNVYEAPVLAPGLALEFPGIKSYVGYNTTDKTASIRFSLSVFGFHGMIMSADGITLIDPFTKDLTQYMVYAKKEAKTDRIFECLVTEVEESLSKEIYFTPKNAYRSDAAGGIFRTYRLALAATEEYSQFHIDRAGVSNGSVAQKYEAVLSAMNTTMTRVNGVFERDLSLTMQIIQNNTAVIFFTPEKPDSLNNNNGGLLLNEIQPIIDGAIGFSNYDIGHVFSTGGGGIAQLNSPCTQNKAKGVTGATSPIGDPFDIDYVAHEIGHQFGATHTFNNSCSNNRSNATAVEPGSGSTIMGYAGICSPNVQNFSDAYFHAVSLIQMDNFIAGTGNCAANSITNNSAPILQPLSNYTLPISTPFVLKANATDVDNDGLTYCWEQLDNQIATQPPVSTSFEGPLFRSLLPSNLPSRYFPALPTVLNGLPGSEWERLPSVSRKMIFAVTVRDNSVPNGGQTARATTTLTVTSAAGPFLVTAPNTAISWEGGSNQTVTWDVAGTTSNGVNTPFVDIYLSTDGGVTFPLLLASQVPNDGAETITVPNLSGTQNRIMVMGHGNIFYDVSNADFSITPASSSMAIGFSGIPGEQNKTICPGNSVRFSFPYSAFEGFSTTTRFELTGQPSGSSVSFTPDTITADGTVVLELLTAPTDPPGSYPLVVTAISGRQNKSLSLYLNILNNEFGSITLLTPPNNSTGNDSVNRPFSWSASTGATGYDLQVATDSNFSNLILTDSTSATTYNATNLPNSTQLFWRVRPKNLGCVGAFSSTATFVTRFCEATAATQVPVTIPTIATTVSSTLTIPAHLNVTIEKVTVNLHLTHSWINDLIVTLISPTGTEVKLMRSECASSPNFQNVMATFDDAGIPVVCQPMPNNALTGVIIPEQPLSAFTNQNSQGVWTLRVEDTVNEDGGSIVNWSLTLCSDNPPLSLVAVKGFDFVLYPNPNKGTFTLQMNTTADEPVEIAVFDLRGRKLLESRFGSEGLLQETIRMPEVAAGVYLVVVKSGQQQAVKRLVVE